MGLLDDAIREHLDLKRSHGASEAELRRQEAEALGPARRPPAPDDETELADEELELADEELELADEELEPADEELEPADEELEPADEGDGADAHDAPTMLDEEPAAAAPAALGDELAAAPDEDEPSPEEEAALSSGRERGEPPTQLDEAEPDEVPSDETLGGPARREYAQGDPLLEEAESRHAEPPGGEEDVLEETPDFLQETPEHDRLWFEQRPPRDFDFD